ncbi:3-keto-disaccharide hydrolase [Lutibacter flavus]|uniref:3-keto-alpha-glucoside-1,2-lyase/3-keto-2-hydroxy-glucal hydratase domain-containing protein n=1 Tax=Lutibacter flavus TaxID=691689 RepID=A0A238X8E9_9FLAO|nr:DUF1080 domain-containing protein [Lutibacter flavus]SNR55306.1 protein of unknown function [Lutibacter flavus]
MNLKKIILFIIVFAIGFFGTKYLFKKDDDSSKNSENQQTETEEWVSLFDGKTFNGWHNYKTKTISDEWQIIDGAMVFTPDPNKDGGINNLVTDNDYTNFKLSIDWKISEGGNSGIFYGVFEDEQFSVPYQTGPEIQILDDLNHPDKEKETHRSGALYDMIAPSEKAVKKVGEWNTCIIEINHKTNAGKIWLNDKEIVSFQVSGKEWDAMISKSKFKDWPGFGTYKTGKIGLQDHGNTVSFRNIKIIEL